MFICIDTYCNIMYVRCCSIWLSFPLNQIKWWGLRACFLFIFSSLKRYHLSFFEQKGKQFIFKINSLFKFLKRSLWILSNSSFQQDFSSLFHVQCIRLVPMAADSSVQILFCDKTRGRGLNFSTRFTSEAGRVLWQKQLSRSEHNHLLLHGS